MQTRRFSATGIAVVVIPLTYGITWLYARLRVPKSKREHFVSRTVSTLFIPMFLGVWGALFIGGFIWMLVAAFFYDRKFSAVPFYPYWLITYFVICFGAAWHVFSRFKPRA